MHFFNVFASFNPEGSCEYVWCYGISSSHTQSRCSPYIQLVLSSSWRCLLLPSFQVPLWGALPCHFSPCPAADVLTQGLLVSSHSGIVFCTEWFKDALSSLPLCAGFLRNIETHHLENLFPIHLQQLKTVPEWWMIHLSGMGFVFL